MLPSPTACPPVTPQCGRRAARLWRGGHERAHLSVRRHDLSQRGQRALACVHMEGGFGQARQATATCLAGWVTVRSGPGWSSKVWGCIPGSHGPSLGDIGPCLPVMWWPRTCMLTAN